MGVDQIPIDPPLRFLYYWATQHHISTFDPSFKGWYTMDLGRKVSPRLSMGLVLQEMMVTGVEKLSGEGESERNRPQLCSIALLYEVLLVSPYQVIPSTAKTSHRRSNDLLLPFPF